MKTRLIGQREQMNKMVIEQDVMAQINQNGLKVIHVLDTKIQIETYQMHV